MVGNTRKGKLREGKIRRGKVIAKITKFVSFLARKWGKRGKSK